MNTSIEFTGEELVIKIPKDFVRATVVYGNDSTVVEPEEAKNFPHLSVMEDFEEFSSDLLSELRREDENGWSLVNEMIHRAAEEAMEQGACGVKYPD